jgi:hypothetical protein
MSTREQIGDRLPILGKGEPSFNPFSLGQYRRDLFFLVECNAFKNALFGDKARLFKKVNGLVYVLRVRTVIVSMELKALIDLA